MSNIVPDELRIKLIEEGKFLVSNIDFDTIRSIERWILRNRIGPEPKFTFTLVINSSGGSPKMVLDFASFLATLSKDVRIEGVTFGECGSAALALLQCCHKRTSVKHCGFFIHNIETKITISCQETSLSDVQRQIEVSRKMEEELVNLQCKRSGITKQKWRKLAAEGQTSPGSVIIAGEAKKLGLVDQVINHYPLF
jgi:ATP-dependent protease ClpP protease subunit